MAGIVHETRATNLAATKACVCWEGEERKDLFLLMHLRSPTAGAEGSPGSPSHSDLLPMRPNGSHPSPHTRNSPESKERPNCKWKWRERGIITRDILRISSWWHKKGGWEKEAFPCMKNLRNGNSVEKLCTR